jgi:hypothetical protein
MQEQPTKPTAPKLIRAYCAIRHTSRGTIYRYTGQFEDGTSRQLREGVRPYVSVAQLLWMTIPGYEGREEFVFSAKPSVNLNKWQRPHIVAEIQIGLDTAAESL